MTTPEKLTLLRKEMQQAGISAFIVYSADPHASEYLPKFWQERTWVSGFTGSAGFAVITTDKAGVWTDSRYFVQATTELKDSGFTLFKEGIEGTPNYIDWLLQELPQGAKVAVNAHCTTHGSWESLSQKLHTKEITLVDAPLLKDLWKNRPEDPQHPIFIHPVAYAGKSVGEKVEAIRKAMHQQGTDLHIVTSLDDVAWITNLRGSDVAYNPVFLGYLLISASDVCLFVSPEKCNEEVKTYLTAEKITLLPYDSFFTELKKVEKKRILVSNNANQSIFEALQAKNRFIIAEPPSQLLKAMKNETELAGFRKVMKRDAVAMVNFLYWISENIGKEAMDEYSIGRTLENFRASQENFVGNSFGEIVGYLGNGAIVHYSAKKESAAAVTNSGTLLVDSGGQYKEGTTDITRVVPLGSYSDAFKKDYTLVLKGMIDLSMVTFPKGTRGVQLDAFARMPLWREYRDYGHGTGHGVGSFLCVHEGPQNIRKDLRDIPLLEGMVCSNEPGLYRENQYGIRIENLIAVRKAQETEFGSFYSFETLTLCPIDTRPIVVELLTEEEKAWLNAYHTRVYEEISPLLEKNQQEWLKNACKAI